MLYFVLFNFLRKIPKFLRVFRTRGRVLRLRLNRNTGLFPFVFRVFRLLRKKCGRKYFDDKTLREYIKNFKFFVDG